MTHPLVSYAAALHGLLPEHIIAPDRHTHPVFARWLAMYMLAKHGFSPSQIGRILHRDHSTVLHALERVQANAEFVAYAEDCLTTLRQLAREAVA